LVTDGRGSSAHSQHGAKDAAKDFDYAVRGVESQLVHCLDNPAESFVEHLSKWRIISEILVAALVNSQRRTAEIHGRPVADFEYTLAAVVIGKHYGAVLQIGDSCIALVKADRSRLALLPDRGEYDNETHFVENSGTPFAHLRVDLFPAEDVTAAFCFTDGLSSKWVDNRTHETAGGIAQIAENLARGEWNHGHIEAYIRHEFWSATSDDDRGLAYLFVERRSQNQRVQPYAK